MTSVFHVGFTGTQDGLTEIQRRVLVRSLNRVFRETAEENVLHEGDCVGADEEACVEATRNRWCLHCHPPVNPSKRAFYPTKYYSEPKGYIPRNHDIVDESQFLIACPGQEEEVLRSGTWATIRYAKQCNRVVLLIFPSGRIEWKGLRGDQSEEN